MSQPVPSLLVFTDVDGCLVNKHDYSWHDARPALQRLQLLQIPVILCSSKTAAELSVLAEDIQFTDTPLICENGTRILWRGSAFGGSRSTVCGIPRADVLQVLSGLKSQFQFRSFVDLGLDGVMQNTDLPQDAAERAMDREGTEPLLWEDDPSRMEAFRQELTARQLTLTKGGRFWHVAGTATKGDAMQQVVEGFQSVNGTSVQTIAVGDSPIDQSMLDCADWPVGIPWPDGSLEVVLPDHGYQATITGAAGWAESIVHLLDRILPTA